ncbi:hypothetical protein BGY98DRAFT_1009441, partial [Russula aff. rugulosa BPL654]
LRATLATVEAPVVYAVPIVAPLPLLYATNQRVPWEWEVSAIFSSATLANKVERHRPRSADRLNVATLLQEDHDLKKHLSLLGNIIEERKSCLSRYRAYEDNRSRRE